MTNQPTSLVYLACPYSHPSEDIRKGRFLIANEMAGLFMCAGIHVFSPISHMHPIAVCHDLPKGWDFWGPFDRVYLEICRAMVVVVLPSWKESVGVQTEIRIMCDLDRPIYYLKPTDHEEFNRIAKELGARG